MSAAGEFSGRTVVVTGGSSGIGAAAAEEFASAGAAVALVARRGADALADELGKRGCSVLSLRADLSVEGEVKRTVNEVIDQFGAIDVLVNCAGIAGPGKIEEITLEAWDEMLRNNLTSQFLCCKYAVPVMKRQKSGKIVNVSSIAGRFRSALSGIHYVTSKAAILGFTRQLAYELAPFHINVNAICPSQTRTPMLAGVLTLDAEHDLAESIPLGHIADPSEQAGVILFLASDAASYMTGAIVDVNGGQW